MVSYAKLREVLVYDAEEGVFTWAVSRGFKRAGTPASRGRITIEGKVYRAGRLAWFYVNGVWPGPNFHHVDDDVLNIRLSNLSNTRRKVAEPRRLTPRSVAMTRVDTGWRLTLREKHSTPVDLGVYPEYDDAVATQRMILQCSISQTET